MIQTREEQSRPNDDSIMLLREAFGCIMTQLSLKEGLKQFGKQGRAIALKEMRQLHDISVFFLCNAKTLSKEERTKTLSSLIFLKEKHSGK